MNALVGGGGEDGVLAWVNVHANQLHPPAIVELQKREKTRVRQGNGSGGKRRQKRGQATKENMRVTCFPFVLGELRNEEKAKGVVCNKRKGRQKR